jgi:hypothetical protein
MAHNHRNGVRIDTKPDKRKKRRLLLCPAHPDQRLAGGGRKYYLHLEKAEDLVQRGMNAQKAKRVINAYPVLTLSHEWLEELFCPLCGSSRWCHVTQLNPIDHTVTWAPKSLWQIVAHVDGVTRNPSVSEYTHRQARRKNQRFLNNTSY